MGKLKSVEELNLYRVSLNKSKDPDKTCITICGGTGCLAFGAEGVIHAFVEGIKKHNLADKVEIKIAGCRGFCEKGPVVVILPKGIFYQRVGIEDVDEIISRTILNGEIVERFLYEDLVSGKKIIYENEVPFYAGQKRLVMADNGRIDPTEISDYIEQGGYSALSKVLISITPEGVIEDVKKSGLRGRGGGGFPTGLKWELCRKAKGEPKYLICNADEGVPGAFMDRSLLEGNPHLVMEGMLIAAYAIGASEGYVYVRAEYPLAVKHIRIAIQQAEEHGLLGDNILGTEFSFHLKVKEGAGAFVCGESTALVLSIEGKRGMPKSLPRPRTTEVGLWDKPTLLNNVKTYANIRWVINKGGDWFASIGTDKSKGTAIFSLTGKIANCGLIEVPMGTTLREIIFDIGGGVPGGKAFKAVQTGGPSGGCLPASLLDTPVDFDSLTAAGSIMGSGGMVVMDEDTCMVDVARYSLDFTQKEACGQCSLCTLGTLQMLEILKAITEGKGKPDDIDLLMELGEAIKIGSICGLGQTAPNPVLTTIRYFRKEYEAHIYEKKCPARVCKELIFYRILPDKCKACMICLRECPVGAIIGEKKQVHVIDQNKCIGCGICLSVCPKRFGAVECVPGKP